MKLTYTRLKNNLIRHRGDRSYTYRAHTVVHLRCIFGCAATARQKQYLALHTYGWLATPMVNLRLSPYCTCTALLDTYD